jgi:predicted metalloprotease with PDZ domain
MVFGLWSLVYGPLAAGADTIEMKDGKELKGIVVEDYHDRILLSTPDGEIQVMKSDIRELSYDTDEDNLIKLGEQAKERGDYVTAYSYYEKAFKMNPNSKLAKDGVTYLKGFVFRKEEAKKEEDIKRRVEYERYQAAGPEAKTKEDFQRDQMDTLKSSIGITLKLIGNVFEVEEVVPKSPADEAGVRKGDCIVAVWGRFTGYMDMEQIIRTLLKQASMEVRVTIERGLDIQVSGRRGPLVGPKELIGASLSMEFDGLTAAEARSGSYADTGGLRKEDLVVAIDGKATRYMPLKEAVSIIQKSKANTVNFKIRRKVTIWRTT